MSYPDSVYVGYGEAIDYAPLTGWINPAQMADDVIQCLVDAGMEPTQIAVNTDDDEIIVSYDNGEEYFQLATDGEIVFFYDINGFDGFDCQLEKPYSLAQFRAIVLPTKIQDYGTGIKTLEESL